MSNFLRIITISVVMMAIVGVLTYCVSGFVIMDSSSMNYENNLMKTENNLNKTSYLDYQNKIISGEDALEKTIEIRDSLHVLIITAEGNVIQNYSRTDIGMSTELSSLSLEELRGMINVSGTYLSCIEMLDGSNITGFIFISTKNPTVGRKCALNLFQTPTAGLAKTVNKGVQSEIEYTGIYPINDESFSTTSIKNRFNAEQYSILIEYRDVNNSSRVAGISLEAKE